MSADVEKLTAAWESLLLTLGAPPAAEEPSAPREQAATTEKQIPVTILSGFLGAGKTTLLCRLLESAPDEILAIVNDVGSINVDAALVRRRNAETIELENGCACCTLGENLREALVEISSRRQTPDAIVIEASGVSDPMGIASTVANVSSMTLDGIVTVVDANLLAERASDPLMAPLFERQLAAAHLVALTRTADRSCVKNLLQTLREVAPGRPVLLTDEISTSGEGALADILLGAANRGARVEPGFSKHAHGGFATRAVQHEKPVDAAAFYDLLDTLPDSVYRIKGWILLREAELPAGRTSRFEVQAAGRRWRVMRTHETGKLSQLVVIGRSGDRAFDNLSAALQALT